MSLARRLTAVELRYERVQLDRGARDLAERLRRPYGEVYADLCRSHALIRLYLARGLTIDQMVERLAADLEIDPAELRRHHEELLEGRQPAEVEPNAQFDVKKAQTA